MRSPAPSSTHLSPKAQHGFPTPNPVPGKVLEGFMEEPTPHPDPVPSSVPEGSQAELPLHSVPVCEGLMDGLPPLPAPVPGPVLEGFEDELPPSLVPVPEEFVEDLSPLPVPVPEGRTFSACCVSADLYGLAEGPSGLRNTPLSSTVGSTGPTTGRQIIVVGPLVAEYWTTCTDTRPPGAFGHFVSRTLRLI
ncbi:hypothetical protein AMECASPLE_037760 [Ameca splendens]|uniref:Uncharacterized protein n=1 Tax=Ameca splendens TaxID=208324 RepID=A0ABV0Z7L5_9TELE